MERIREATRLGADILGDLTERELKLQDSVRSRDREIPKRNKQRIDKFLHREGGGGGRVAKDSTVECASGEDGSGTENSGSRFRHNRTETMAVDEIIGVAVPRKARSCREMCLCQEIGGVLCFDQRFKFSGEIERRGGERNSGRF